MSRDDKKPVLCYMCQSCLWDLTQRQLDAMKLARVRRRRPRREPDRRPILGVINGRIIREGDPDAPQDMVVDY